MTNYTITLTEQEVEDIALALTTSKLKYEDKMDTARSDKIFEMAERKRDRYQQLRANVETQVNA